VIERESEGRREGEESQREMPFQLQREEIRRKRGKKPSGRRRGVEKLTFYARGLWFSRGLPTNQSFSCARFLFFPGTLTAHAAAA